MRSYQIHESGYRSPTTHIGGGSDHEGARVLAWLIIIVVVALALLALNYIAGVSIDALVSIL